MLAGLARQGDDGEAADRMQERTSANAPTADDGGPVSIMTTSISDGQVRRAIRAAGAHEHRAAGERLEFERYSARKFAASEVEKSNAPP